MASLQALVTLISDDYVPDLNSRTAVLRALDRAIKRLFNNETSETTFYNYSDPVFPFPLLNTVTGTLSYEITAANLIDSTGAAIALEANGVTVEARRLRRIFVSETAASSSQFLPKFRGDNILISGINSRYSSNLFTARYREVIGDIRQRSNEAPCTFVFMEDPGTHSDLYYAEFYYAHPNITSESDPVLIDLDEWEQALIDGAVGFIEDYRHGSSDRLNKFEQYWVKKYVSAANEGAVSRIAPKMRVREAG